MVSRCNGTNTAGGPCEAQPVRSSGFCYWHDPSLASERHANRRRGGSARSNAARAKKALPDTVLSPAEIQGMLGLALRDVLAGRLEPGVANAAASLGRALVQVREATEVEERLQALERAAGRPARGWTAR